MNQDAVLATVLGMALVTFLPRFLPTWLLASRRINPVLERWLRLIPPAVLAAMLGPALVMDGSRLAVDSNPLFLLAALPTGLAAYLTRSLFWALAVGLGVVAGSRYFGVF